MTSTSFRFTETRTATLTATRISSEGDLVKTAHLFIPTDPTQDYTSNVAWNGAEFAVLEASYTSTRGPSLAWKRSLRASVVAPETRLPFESGVEIFSCRCFFGSLVIRAGDGFLVRIIITDGSLLSPSIRSTHLLRLDANGVVTASVSIGKAILQSTCPASELGVSGDLVHLDGPSCTALVDEALQVVAGPVDLSEFSAMPQAMYWSKDRNSVAVAYEEPAITPNDVFFGRKSATGGPNVGPVRLSDGHPESVADDGDLAGVLFASTSTLATGSFAAFVDADGLKLGGDIPVFQMIPMALPPTVTITGHRTFSAFAVAGGQVAQVGLSCAP